VTKETNDIQTSIITGKKPISAGICGVDVDCTIISSMLIEHRGLFVHTQSILAAFAITCLVDTRQHLSFCSVLTVRTSPARKGSIVRVVQGA
jgi:hypothetical protein